MVNQADRLFQQGLALLNQAKLEQAKEIFEKVVKLNAKHFDAYNLLGIISAQLKAFEQADGLFDKAIKLNPNNAAFFCNRGNVLKEMKQFENAITHYNNAINLKKDYALAYLNKSIAVCALKRFEEALSIVDKAIKVKSDYAEAYYQRGFYLTELKRYVESLASYDKAIDLRRGYSEAYSNRGIVLKELKRLEEALTSYDCAIELKHDYAEAHSNRGIVLQELKRLDESLASYDKAIELKSDYAEAYFNKSLLLLSMQDFESGWQLYDWRWRNKNFNSTYLSSNKPKLINIESAHTKKLLLWGEQGIGDQILYTGMIDQFLNISPSSQILLDERLLPLLHRSFPQGKFIDKTIAIEDIEHDEHLSIADLGKYLRTCNSDFDINRYHYLLADQRGAKKIRSSLISNKKFLCGVTWSSKIKKIGAEKSIQLDDLLPVLSLKNISFVSLQYGNVQKQLAEFNEKHDINILECDSVDNFYDLDGHASLIEACDFVITISNTSAHMAGAIGKETYLMCPSGKGLLWYWSNQTNGKSLWYPSIHIIEQNAPGQWTEVVLKIKLEIEKKLNENE